MPTVHCFCPSLLNYYLLQSQWPGDVNDVLHRWGGNGDPTAGYYILWSEHLVNNYCSTHVCCAWSVETFRRTTIDIDTLNSSYRCDFSAVYRIVFKRDYLTISIIYSIFIPSPSQFRICESLSLKGGQTDGMTGKTVTSQPVGGALPPHWDTPHFVPQAVLVLKNPLAKHESWTRKVSIDKG